MAEAAAAAEEAADEDMADQLAELDELSALLGLQVEDPAAISEGRPATNSTTASASTTAPSGSKAGELSSLGDSDELRHEDGGKEGALDFQHTLNGVARLQRELPNCRLPHGCRLETSQASPAQFFFTMDVTEGPYMPATITFWIKVFEDFPAPGSCRIRATKRIFHPFINPTTGTVELPEDSLYGSEGEIQLRSLVLAVRDLIFAPPDTPAHLESLAVNEESAALLRRDSAEFRRVVRLTLNGGEHGGVKFDRVLNPSSLGRSGGKEKDAVFASSKPVSEKVMVDLMQLESMKEKFKLQATEWQLENMGSIMDVQAE